MASSAKVLPQMTDEMRAALASGDDPAAVLAAAEAFGVDLNHLRRNLQLTPEQRLDRLQAAVNMYHAARNAKPL